MASVAAKGKKRESIRLFENPYLEKLSHVHPITPLVFWSPVIAYLLWRSVTVLEISLLSIAGLGIAALFVWTLAEYVLHRHVFHFHAKSKFLKRVMYIIHENHHDDPNDPTRLVMPPVAGVLLAIPLYLMFRLVLGPVYIEPFFAFFLIGYLCYDYTHYAVHHFIPKTKWGKLVKQHHMLHHFATPDIRWGVSNTLWDHVFNTAGISNAKKKRPQQPVAG